MREIKLIFPKKDNHVKNSKLCFRTTRCSEY